MDGELGESILGRGAELGIFWFVIEKPSGYCWSEWDWRAGEVRAVTGILVKIILCCAGLSCVLWGV